MKAVKIQLLKLIFSIVVFQMRRSSYDNYPNQSHEHLKLPSINLESIGSYDDHKK